MRSIAALLLVASVVTSCSGGDDPADAAVTTVPDAVVVDDAPASGDTTAEITVAESADVSALGVVLAAVLLAEGDVEQAVSDGLVTVAEVDAAVAAIRDGTIDQWVTLAAD